MKRLLVILIALGCATAYCNAQDTNIFTPQLPPVQSDMMPTIGTHYLITPSWIYHSTGDPGPASDDLSKAWDLGNEFVFRTALRNGVVMPATLVDPVSNGWFQVGFKTPEGKDAGLLFVNIKSNTVMLSE